MPLYKLCKFCKIKFLRNPHKALKQWITEVKYCSQKCHYADRKNIKHSEEWKNKIRQTNIMKYKTDPKFREIRRLAMIKARHPKHPGHGPKISATRKRLFREGVLSTKGKDNPAWEGGKSFETYSQKFNDALKEKVRFSAGYKCQICGCPQIETGEKLIVHHKDCNKKNNQFSNFAALCRHCHINLHWKIRKGQVVVGHLS